MAEWLPDVKTADISKPVDVRLEQAMLLAYGKGLKDGEQNALKDVVDVECKVVDE